MLSERAVCVVLVKDRQIALSWCLKNERTTLDLCPVNAGTGWNKYCFYAHLEEILGIGLVMELVHPKAADSYLKVEKNPPSVLLCAVVSASVRYCL